jgi:hypothetical protein
MPSKYIRKKKKRGQSHKGQTGFAPTKARVQKARVICMQHQLENEESAPEPDVLPELTMERVQTHSNTVEQLLTDLTDGDYPLVSSVANAKATRRAGDDPVLRHAKTDEVYGVIYADGLYWLLLKCWREQLLFVELGSGQCIVLSHRIAFPYWERYHNSIHVGDFENRILILGQVSGIVPLSQRCSACNARPSSTRRPFLISKLVYFKS